MVHEQMESIYAKYFHTQYHESIRKTCETFFEVAFTEHHELIKRILKWEQCRPKTCNDEAIDLAQSRALDTLQTKRRDIRAVVFLDEQEVKTGRFSTGQTRVEKLAKITDAQLGVDPNRKEIEAMAVGVR